MWVMTMFDLPVESPLQRKRYAKFRSTLIKWGYDTLQKSIYVKYCQSDDYCHTIRKMVAQIAPAEGIVNSFSFTDLEFERQDFIRDGERSSPPPKPAQTEFF